MRIVAAFLLGFVAPRLASPFSAQDQQAEFARQALAALTSGDEEFVSTLVYEAPYRARLLAHELAWEGLRAGPEDPSALRTARRLAGLLVQEAPDETGARLDACLDRAEGLAPDERVLQREMDLAFFSAARALARGEVDVAAAEAGGAAELAATLELDYVEMRARRLLAEARRSNGVEFCSSMERVLELERRLGLWTDVLSDSKALSDVEVELGRLESAAVHLQEAERHARWIEAHEEAVELMIRRGAVLSNSGLFEEANEVLGSALASFEGAGDERGVARVLTLLGELASGAGRYADALRRYAEAERTLRHLGDGSGAGRAAIRMAGAYSELGFVADAEDALERARGTIEPLGLEAEDLQWRLLGGLVQLDAGHADDALASLRALAGDGLPEALRAEVLRQMGSALLALERPEEAAEAFRQALAAWSADPLKNAWARTGLGEALTELGQIEEAREAYEQALFDAKGVASLEGSWRARFGLGRSIELAAERSQAERGEALGHYLRAIDEVEALRSSLSAPTLRTRWLGNKLELYHRTARLLAEEGRLEEAYRYAEAAKSRTLLELAARNAAHTESPAADAARERLIGTESRLRLLEAGLRALPLLPSSVGTQRSLIARLRAERAEHEAARLELQLAEPRALGLRGLADSPTLEESGQALASDERLLHYSVGPAGVSLFVVGPKTAAFVELETTEAELEALVERILGPIERLREGRLDLATLGFDAWAARELHRLLIEPASAMLAEARLLWVVPDGVLRRLPFALLVSRREKRPVDLTRLFAQYEGCRFLIEDRAVALLPSAGLLVASRAAGRPSGSFLVVAAAGPPSDEAPALAWARREARALLASGEGKDGILLEGEEAGEGRVKAALLGARVAHFATHGWLDDRRPAFSRLALVPEEGEDGWLHAHEVEGLALESERVVLSACETLGQAGRGEGLLGLARSFLLAGARSVVCTAWAVDDQATSELMGLYHEATERGEAPIAALRTAQVALLRGPGRAGLRYLHPCFWAGFQHVGAR